MRASLVLLIAAIMCAARADAQTAPTREGFVTTRDGAKLYYQLYGERGDTIVHLHGGPGGSLTGQLPNLLQLSSRHVLISYDQRGGGRSVPVDTTSISPAAHVRDLEDLRKALNIPRMTLYGHSWGTALATMYAAEYPAHVRQLILNGPMPPARVLYDEQRSTAVRNAIRRLCEARAAAQQSQPAATVVEECIAFPRITARVYYHDTLNIARNRSTAGGDAITPDGRIANRITLAHLGDWDFRPLMAKVQARTLVIEGEHTPVPLDQVRVWAATVPNARLWLVPKTGHAYPHIENPDYFFPALETFLRGDWPADARDLPRPDPF